VPINVSFIPAPVIFDDMATPAEPSIKILLSVEFPSAKSIVPVPPPLLAIVSTEALELLLMITLLTEFTVAPFRVRTPLDEEELPMVRFFEPAKSIAPRARDPFAALLVETPLDELVPMLIPKVLPEKASVVNTAISPALPSIVELELASTPGMVLAGPPVQLLDLTHAVPVVVVFQV
jgi:hypothetical protein